MRRSAATRCGVVVLVLLIGGRPAMGQHPRGGAVHPGAVHHGGMMPHPGNGGMVQVHPQVQRQIQQQQQQMMRQMQHQVHQQYQQDLKQFDQWLKANGHGANGSAASRLPKDAAGFDAWAATQKQRKAQGKSYDPLYDHFRAFAGEQGANHGRGAHAGSGASQAASKGGAKHDKATADRQKREEARANARHADDRNRGTRAQDQVNVNHLLTVHARLREADHDYDGNRVRAMHSIGQAIHHLGGSAPMGLAGGMSGLGGLAQGQSDGILRDAISRLKNVESQLGGTAGGAPHHAQARTSIGEAIHHLEVALRIR